MRRLWEALRARLLWWWLGPIGSCRYCGEPLRHGTPCPDCEPDVIQCRAELKRAGYLIGEHHQPAKRRLLSWPE